MENSDKSNLVDVSDVFESIIFKNVVNTEYNCKNTCRNYTNCIYGSGECYPYDCDKCSADTFVRGFIVGVAKSYEFLKR